MSLGESRVRTQFNPSALGLVDQLKQGTAKLIDMCDQVEVDTVGYEAKRLWRIAMERYEEAAMWAVKAATFKE